MKPKRIKEAQMFIAAVFCVMAVCTSCVDQVEKEPGAFVTVSIEDITILTAREPNIIWVRNDSTCFQVYESKSTVELMLSCKPERIRFRHVPACSGGYSYPAHWELAGYER